MVPVEYFPRSLYGHDEMPDHPMAPCLRQALGTDKPYWEWLEDKISVKNLRDGCHNGTDGGPSPYAGLWGAELHDTITGKADDDMIPRPELAIFGRAMSGHVDSFSAFSQYGMEHAHTHTHTHADPTQHLECGART
jgi:hypothetical protein